MKKKKTEVKISRETREGKVIRNMGSAYVVRFADGSVANCRVKGNFRIKGIRTTNPVAVGELVDVARSADDAD